MKLKFYELARNTHCKWPQCNKELTGQQTEFCSRGCMLKYHVTKRRKELKIKALAYKDNKCKLCGYDRCSRALQFHHLEGNKDFGISEKGYTRSWERIKKELDKCILVCSNCHAEIHEGLVIV